MDRVTTFSAHQIMIETIKKNTNTKMSKHRKKHRDNTSIFSSIHFTQIPIMKHRCFLPTSTKNT